MAWNTPGSENGDREPRPRGRGRGFAPNDLLDRLKDMSDGNGPWRWLALVLGLWLVWSTFELVSEQQRGVVLRFGQFARIMAPGPHLKAPWPIERVIKVNATEIKTYTQTVPVLTSDENIVNVDLNVQYRVADPQLYLFGTRDADEVLKEASLSTVREMVGRSNLDTVLGSRNALAVAARTRLEKSLQAYRTGLTVTELNLPNARPPEEVKPAFDDVNSAQQDKDRVISEARAYAAKVIPEARGEAARVRAIAEGEKESAIARATGDAQRFSLLVEQYKAAPEVTRKRLWLETVQQVLSENRTIVGGDSRQLIYVPMNDATTATQPVTPPLLAAPQNAPAIVPDVLAPVTATGDSGGRGPRAPRAPRSAGDER
ncbi:FtsH protease activity modulator HflK [Lysobacter sp. TY2-98]|uniref:FtsH protease activity modulator HflK n=1 Tax=Lysobacter sp. TY2-98 TaxID=2290922 RepID=UPI000E1FFA95|nr:FtsH protease activity modulator HflK [Lysobacter sp. TY2-98]AXK72408.1 FtsH protease activity modulator HflK [Lysobacter sp. TY2-98]